MDNYHNPLVVVADDDADVLCALATCLRGWDFRVLGASTKTELLQHLSQEQPALLLLDLQFGAYNGIEILQELLDSTPELTIVLLTGHGSIDSAVTAIKLGAYDYITKPPDLHRLQVLLKHAVEKQKLSQRVKRLEELAEPAEEARQIWGDSAPIQQVRDLVATVAPTDVSVLILGESGTGKELVARALHEQSNRRRGPFVPVNMAALPHNLVESTLFGHEKGAFTGAEQMHIGCCGAADGGTLFLDEIGDIDLEIQAKLLRFLQDHAFMRVGSSKTQTVDVRVLAATNQALEEQVRAGRFREDLYYRVQVVPVVLPPLRERRQDIPLLAGRFLKRSALRHRKAIRGFSPAALADLTRYDWPGNVRQLENLVERLVILARGTELDREHLPAEIRQTDRLVPEEDTIGSLPEGADTALRRIDQLERRAIINALHEGSGSVRKAAELLGLGQATVYRKIKRYGIPLRERLRVL